MKNWIFSVVLIILGLLIAFGTSFLFPVCELMGDNIMKCFWTARAELGIGIVIAVTGVLLLLSKNKGLRLGLYLSSVLLGILALLVPNVLIGVCAGAMMTCHTLALPALSILSVIVILVGIVNSLYFFKKSRGLQRENEK